MCSCLDFPFFSSPFFQRRAWWINLGGVGKKKSLDEREVGGDDGVVRIAVDDCCAERGRLRTEAGVGVDLRRLEGFLLFGFGGRRQRRVFCVL